MRIDTVSIVNDFAKIPYGIINRALKRNLVEINNFNPRNYAKTKYQKVDDKIYGSNTGMLMLSEILFACIEDIKNIRAKNSVIDNLVIYTSPRGKKFTQNDAKCLAKTKGFILIAGHYAGIDTRVRKQIDLEYSITDAIISSGEIAALFIIDSVCRLLPNAIKSHTIKNNESYENSLLEADQYTKPQICEDESVPKVLLQGNHRATEEWNLKNSLITTYLNRPDMLEQHKFTPKEAAMLNEYFLMEKP